MSRCLCYNPVMDARYVASGVAILAGVAGLSWFSGKDAPYVATLDERISTALDLAELLPGQVFYELGSGDGRVVLAAAARGVKAIGIEESWLRVWQSQLAAWRGKLPTASFIHGDIFTRRYDDANAVFIYLLPRGVAKLEQKLRQELAPGTRIVTQTYHFPTWKPIKTVGSYCLYQA